MRDRLAIDVSGASRWLRSVGASMPRAVWCAPFVALSLLLYARVLDGWFMSDDSMLGMIIPDGQHVNWAHVRKTFTTDWLGGSHMGYYRPLVIVTQAIDAELWGLDPRGFHLTNVILHGITGYLLFELVRSFGMGAFPSAVAGTAFLVHPAHVESVVWISGRTDVLATMLATATLVFHRFRRDGAFRESAWAILCCALALASKESAIAVLPIIVAMDLLIPVAVRVDRGRIGRAIPTWVAYGAVTGLYLAVRSAAIGDTAARGHDGWMKAWSDPNLWENATHSLFVLVTPFNRFEAGDATDVWSQACAIVGAALLVPVVTAALARTARWDVFALSVAAFGLSIAPVLNIFAITDDLVSSRLGYSATAWICVAVAALGAAPRNVIARVPSVALLGLYALMLQMNQVPWIEAGDIIRTVRDRYAEEFGSYVGEAVEGLPRIHKGAYLALYQAVVFARPFIDESPNLQAVAAKRAVYSPSAGLRTEADAAFGAARRLRDDNAGADWLWPRDVNPFEASRPKDLTAESLSAGAIAAYRSTSKDPWIEIPLEPPEPADDEPVATEDTVYLLMRTPEIASPELFWAVRGRAGMSGGLRLRPDLEVRDGKLGPVLVDGFVVYSAILDAEPSWPGTGRVSVLRVDPLESEGLIEIRFLDVASRPRRIYTGDANVEGHR